MKPEAKPQMNVITRNDFLKNTCLLGLCGCMGTTLAADQPKAAEAETEQVRDLRGKLDFVQIRFAKLVEILNSSLDEPTRAKVFEELGRECARQFSYLSAPFKGDLKGFLAKIQTQWVEKVEHDEQSRTIRITDRNPKCSCALVAPQKTPGAFCDCSRGWQKETYSSIVGEPVEVEVVQSILRGAPRCAFVIRYT
jgi:predicted hydrocarbon binding protein